MSASLRSLSKLGSSDVRRGADVNQLKIWKNDREVEGEKGKGKEEEGNIYFKELAHATVGVGKSEIYRAGQQAGNSGRISMFQSWGRTPSSLGNLSFALKAFNLLDEAHPHYQGQLLLLKVNWLEMLITATKYLHSNI